MGEMKGLVGGACSHEIENHFKKKNIYFSPR
jgi:hypothetical protein